MLPPTHDCDVKKVAFENLSSSVVTFDRPIRKLCFSCLDWLIKSDCTLTSRFFEYNLLVNHMARALFLRLLSKHETSNDRQFSYQISNLIDCQDL